MQKCESSPYAFPWTRSRQAGRQPAQAAQAAQASSQAPAGELVPHLSQVNQPGELGRDRAAPGRRRSIHTPNWCFTNPLRTLHGPLADRVLPHLNVTPRAGGKILAEKSAAQRGRFPKRQSGKWIRTPENRASRGALELSDLGTLRARMLPTRRQRAGRATPFRACGDKYVRDARCAHMSPCPRVDCQGQR